MAVTPRYDNPLHRVHRGLATALSLVPLRKTDRYACWWRCTHADSYRICPASQNLTEACFQAHPLDFVQDKQALLLGNGTKIPITGVFTNKGTSPRGSTWARLPVPSGGLGPRCECDMDTHYKAGDFKCGCKPCETLRGNCSKGPCEPCPETAGSDCSRCANPPKGGTMFPAPASAAVMRQRPAVYDQVRVPQLPPGKYVVGFRYDCDATAQVCERNAARPATPRLCTPTNPHLRANEELSWLPRLMAWAMLHSGSNCADITIE